MALSNTRTNRQTIPNWNLFYQTPNDDSNFGTIREIDRQLPDSDITSEYEAWLKNPNFYNTVRLYNLGMVINNVNIIYEMLDYSEKNGWKIDRAIKEQRKTVVDNKHFTVEEFISTYETRIVNEFGKYEKVLLLNKENPYALIMLSFLNHEVGDYVESKRYMEEALKHGNNILPVLRIASVISYNSRVDEYQQFFLSVLRKNEFTNNHAWLLSAELAFSDLLNLSSRKYNKARYYLMFGGGRNDHRSELLSVLGTIEASSSLRKSREYFNKALISPARNVIPQAEYISGRNGITVSEDLIIQSKEASTYDCFNKGLYLECENFYVDWFQDEPYSENAIYFGSAFNNSIKENFEMAEKLAAFGIKKYPYSFSILNSLVYAMIMRSKLDEAKKYFMSIKFSDLNEYQKMTYLATAGLIKYAEGDFESGNDLYERAQNLAIANGVHNLALFIELFHYNTIHFFNINNDKKFYIINRIEQATSHNIMEISHFAQRLKNKYLQSTTV